ncbi:hypothetical protein Tco_1352446 [Tanacetum coccineum]
MAELILKSCVGKDRTESRLSNTNTKDDVNIKLSKEFLMELKHNTYHGRIDEDVVVDHIATILKIFDLINIPESYDGEEEMLDEGDNWGIDPIEFISRVNSSFENHNKVDGRTKKMESKNPPNTATNSFFKAYNEHDNEEGNVMRQMKRKDDNMNDEQPNKKVSKAEKFEAIKYSLGTNEEYIVWKLEGGLNSLQRDKDGNNQTKTPRFYSGSATKLFFALLHSPSILLEISLCQQAPFRRRKPFTRRLRVGDEEVVVGEGVVVTSSLLEMLTNSCLGGIMVSLIFLEGLWEEALVEFMVELFEEDEDGKSNEMDGLFNLKVGDQSGKACELRKQILKGV